MPDPRVKVLVVWEHVLPTDFASPSQATMAEISDSRAVQFWDPGRMVSKAMGEHPGEKNSIVWDWVALYSPAAQWTEAPPEPLFSGRTVVSASGQLRERLAQALAAGPASN